MSILKDLEFKKVCLNLSLKAAEESRDSIRDLFLFQAARIEQEICQLEMSYEGQMLEKESSPKLPKAGAVKAIRERYYSIRKSIKPSEELLESLRSKPKRKKSVRA